MKSSIVFRAPERCTFVIAAADDPPGLQWLERDAACTTAEYFSKRQRRAAGTRSRTSGSFAHLPENPERRRLGGGAGEVQTLGSVAPSGANCTETATWTHFGAKPIRFSDSSRGFKLFPLQGFSISARKHKVAGCAGPCNLTSCGKIPRNGVGRGRCYRLRGGSRVSPPFTTVKRRAGLHAEAGAAKRITTDLGRITVPNFVPYCARNCAPIGDQY